MIYNIIDIFALLLAHPRCIAAGCSPKTGKKETKKQQNESEKEN